MTRVGCRKGRDKFAMDLIGKHKRDSALNGILQLNVLSRFVLRAQVIATSLQILPYFFYNCFISSTWPLIFYIIKFNTSLYRFLFKFLKFVTIK